MAIEAAQLMVTVGANTAGAEAGLKRVSGDLMSFKGIALGTAGAIGIAADAALVMSLKLASDYQTMVNQVQNNTTMSAAQVGVMQQSIQKLASGSSAPLDQLAQGWMHITNLGFNAADSQNILKAAMESATSTGADTATVANVLANVMHEYGMKSTDAAQAMDVLHLAAAQGNMTLEQLTENGGQALAMAANLGVSYTDVAGAISAMTRHGFDAAQAGTQVKDMMTKLVAPSAAARKELALLSQTTGVDLTRDFTQAGLDAKGLPGVMDDIQKATHGNSSEILRLIPNMRGGLAAMVLAGTGAKDYSSILGQLNDTMSGKLTPTADAYARTQQTLAFQTAELKNNLQLAGIAIGTVLLPPITKLAQLVVPLIQDFAQWSQAHAQLATGILATVGALGTLAGGFQMVRMAGMLLGPVLGPVVGLLGGFLWPILAVAAAGAALYIAWQNDWGGIREITQQVAGQIQGIVTTVLGVIQTTWDAHSQAIMALARQAWGIIQSIITAVVGAVRQFILEEFGVVIDWAKANWPLIQETISDVMNKVLDVVQMVLGGLVSFWQANGATIMAVVRLAWDMVKAIIDTAIHVVLDLITLTMDLITGHWQGAWNQVLDILSRIWGLIKKLVGDEMAILGTILDSFVPELLAKAQELGAAIMNGIKAGIEAGVGALEDAVANAAQGALNAAKSALGIHSPSTAFATIGQQMAQGLANGITANAHLAANAARQMAQATLAFSLGTSSSGGAGMLAPAAFTGSVEPFVPPTLSGGWGGSGGSQGGPAATFAPVITLYNYGALGVNDAEDWLVSTMQQAWRQGRFDTMFAMPIH